MDILKNIRRVEVSDDLYDQVMARIREEKRNRVPLRLVGAAAAVFLCLLFGELFLLTRKQAVNPAESVETLVEVPNNALYDE